MPYFIASALGYGAGEVRAVTYEYGNAFLIVAGLLNLLVVIDAYDIAHGPQVMQSHLAAARRCSRFSCRWCSR